jgi:hypothetical protein
MPVGFEKKLKGEEVFGKKNLPFIFFIFGFFVAVIFECNFPY